MPAAKKPPAGGTYPNAHKAASWVALAIAVLTFLTSALGVWQNGSARPTRAQVAKVAVPVAKQQAQAAISKTAARLVNTAANAPQPANQACSVPAGQGTMGACAPQAILPRDLAGAVTAAASAVDQVHGLIGADTSSFQSCAPAPHWISFWIVKATEGTGYRDRCTATDVRIAKRQHQVYGTYDFMRATGSYAGAEASTYINYARGSGASKGLHVLDVEAGTLPASTLHAYVCSWVSIVKHALGGQVVIYTGNWFWGPRIGGNTCGAILWDSAYASYAQLPATWGGGFIGAYGWSPYVGQRGHYRASTPLWQYSDGVYGPHPRVNRWDTDTFFGTRKQLDQLAGLAPRVRPCSKRTACRMGRRHARIHAAIAARCHPAAKARRHRAACRKLRHRNDYIHGYAHSHHLALVTR